ncbi:MAG: YkgJ family cysteine cluster protein [Eubacterium sp.]|nr:YkgJ family cysteine cluster protein [Eubacterium sp.]
MIRNEAITEISDGRFYTANDEAPLGCNECEGCSACCRDMGDSVILDPLDLCRITLGLGKTFRELLENELEIAEIDNIALPHLNMDGATHACRFLNDAGRCSIHPFRPGICPCFLSADTMRTALSATFCRPASVGKKTARM